ncbi:hypothetical protein [Niabella hibiscisoli]|uniref:hypothetical protein n=1 Tax=Niabella hibiscisoli TaxID=1825928 RepID=UPI001F0CF8F6|nr:hypothetical protein [Niabella hibiscisoli]MCH5715664.1 hypothetical protein [Niabella hibiscisoli]
MKRSNLEIDEILNSLDGISRAEARPYMHTRIMARIQEENSFWTKTVGFLTRPAVAIACVLVVLMANAYTVLNSEYPKQEVSTITSSVVSDGLQNENYILAVNDVNP